MTQFGEKPAALSRARLGLFGGTFDPPHHGHFALAQAAIDQLRLDRVLWILTGLQPLKRRQRITPAEKRLDMLELVIGDNPRFSLSRVETERPGPHYSVDTVQILAKDNPGADLVLLIGGDSLHDLPRWQRPVELVSACAEIGVMHRPGDSIDLPALETKIPGLTAKVRFIDTPLLNISASDIRRRIAAGQDVHHLISPAIYNYIHQHGLYQ